ncbi:hypothetical protein HN51_005183 [Arachis hypogaea]|uniref:Uncharacterized protein n=1 Tax=Arachis hypogaea TaxID=3818 RepID=A0A445DFX5_ARAHY|nr:uncharacterized protein DS421_4g124410 [Arachis hypogaea]RYR62022.1 hypothetical protein Ahy_A04g019325 [Arachis hypogaea]
MSYEITEEKDDEEEPHWFINTEQQKAKIRKIIDHQKSLYPCSSVSLLSRSSSSSSASCSSCHSSLLGLMKSGSTCLRRLFEMEHTSLGTHFDCYSGSPIFRPISLWDSESERQYQDPWAFFKKIGSSSSPPFVGTQRESELASNGSYTNEEYAYINNRKNEISVKRKLTRKKAFRRLPGFGLWICGRFRFSLRLRFRRLKIFICNKVFK